MDDEEDPSGHISGPEITLSALQSSNITQQTTANDKLRDTFAKVLQYLSSKKNDPVTEVGVQRNHIFATVNDGKAVQVLELNDRSHIMISKNKKKLKVNLQHAEDEHMIVPYSEDPEPISILVDEQGNNLLYDEARNDILLDNAGGMYFALKHSTTEVVLSQVFLNKQTCKQVILDDTKQELLTDRAGGIHFVTKDSTVEAIFDEKNKILLNKQTNTKIDYPCRIIHTKEGRHFAATDSTEVVLSQVFLNKQTGEQIAFDDTKQLLNQVDGMVVVDKKTTFIISAVEDEQTKKKTPKTLDRTEVLLLFDKKTGQQILPKENLYLFDKISLRQILPTEKVEISSFEKTFIDKNIIIFVDKARIMIANRFDFETKEPIDNDVVIITIKADDKVLRREISIDELEGLLQTPSWPFLLVQDIFKDQTNEALRILGAERIMPFNTAVQDLINSKSDTGRILARHNYHALVNEVYKPMLHAQYGDISRLPLDEKYLLWNNRKLSKIIELWVEKCEGEARHGLKGRAVIDIDISPTHRGNSPKFTFKLSEINGKVEAKVIAEELNGETVFSSGPLNMEKLKDHIADSLYNENDRMIDQLFGAEIAKKIYDKMGDPIKSTVQRMPIRINPDIRQVIGQKRGPSFLSFVDRQASSAISTWTSRDVTPKRQKLDTNSQRSEPGSEARPGGAAMDFS